MFSLKGKTALVTGATQGIGFEIARLFSAQGAKVFINGAKSEEKCAEASGKIPDSIPICADLTKKEERETLFKKTGGVDILVLNASIQYKHAWDEFTDCGIAFGKNRAAVFKNGNIIKTTDPEKAIELLINIIKDI